MIFLKSFLKSTSLFFTMALLVACTNNSDAKTAMTAEKVKTHEWQLSHMEGQDNLKSTYQQFRLSFKDGSISAKAFNRFRTSVSIDDNANVSFGKQVISTRKGIANPELEKLERQFIGQLTKATTWSATANTLSIGTGQNQLLFKK